MLSVFKNGIYISSYQNKSTENWIDGMINSLGYDRTTITVIEFDTDIQNIPLKEFDGLNVLEFSSEDTSVSIDGKPIVVLVSKYKRTIYGDVIFLNGEYTELGKLNIKKGR